MAMFFFLNHGNTLNVTIMNLKFTIAFLGQDLILKILITWSFIEGIFKNLQKYFTNIKSCFFLICSHGSCFTHFEKLNLSSCFSSIYF